MVGDIKQIVSSLSVGLCWFFILRVLCIKLFTVHLCRVLVLENQEPPLKYPGKFVWKTFMNLDCVYTCSNGSVVKFTTV